MFVICENYFTEKGKEKETAKYLHGKCAFKFEKGWYNVLQEVKTLLVNKKDKNTAAVFFISLKHLRKWLTHHKL